MPTPRVRAAISSGKVHGIVLAGGSGRRLGAITDPTINRNARQKAICPLGSHEIIDTAMAPLKKLGLDKLHVFTGFLGKEVQALLSAKYGTKVVFTQARFPFVNTAGNVLRVLRENDPEITDGTVIVKSSDIASNISTVEPLDEHIEHGNNGATIVVSPTAWAALHNYGTIRTEDMPRKVALSDRADIGSLEHAQKCFEEALEIYYRKHAGQSMRILGFQEKAVMEQAFSNLTNSSDYYISVAMLRAFGPHMTETDPLKGGPSFSDFGSHLWPALTIRHLRKSDIQRLEFFQRLRTTYQDDINDGLMARIMNGEFPLLAYLMPLQTEEGKDSYLRDLGRPDDYFEANMAVLKGKLANKLLPQNITPKEDIGHTVIVNSIIDPEVEILQGAMIINSVVRSGIVEEGSHTIVGPKARIINSVIFPSLWPREKVSIGHDNETTLVNCIVTGGCVNGHFIAKKTEVKTVFADKDNNIQIETTQNSI